MFETRRNEFSTRRHPGLCLSNDLRSGRVRSALRVGTRWAERACTHIGRHHNCRCAVVFDSNRHCHGAQRNRFSLSAQRRAGAQLCRICSCKPRIGRTQLRLFSVTRLFGGFTGWLPARPSFAKRGCSSFFRTRDSRIYGLLSKCHSGGEMAARLGSTFAVIPAGERWGSGELRPSLED